MEPPGPGSKPKPGPAPSAVSQRSDRSQDLIITFQSQDQRNMDPPGPESEPEPESAPSSESLRSNRSKVSSNILDSSGPGSKSKPQPRPSAESLKSDHSRVLPILFRGAFSEDQSTYDVDSAGPGSKPRPKPPPSSLRSDGSNVLPIHVSDALPEDWRKPRPTDQLDSIFTRLEMDIQKFVKKQLQKFHKLLVSENPESPSENEEEQRSIEAVLDLTLDFLKRMDQECLAEHLRKRSSTGVYIDKLKSQLQQRYGCVFEGVAKAGNPTPLHQIYTEVSIVQEGPSDINQQHEFSYIETASRKPITDKITIACEDIFKPHQTHIQQPEQSVTGEQMKSKKQMRAELMRRQSRSAPTEGPIRIVLTKGVAGIGKTVLTQKFSLDWAEGKSNQDIEMLFPLTFRDLNVLSNTEFSLMELVQHCFSQIKGLLSFKDLQVVFILDSLDECRLPLDFSRTRVLTEPTDSASVEELLVNLIRGDLLPFARLWITTRPAAANQIPAEYISMVTEVQGFADLQKEQYFMKRFSDKQQAMAIIAHIKRTNVLYVMCYIPIFCWILSTILHHLSGLREGENLPKTLTQMYIHFLVVQAKIKNIKYHGGSGSDLHWTPETREMVLSLAKLAFEHVEKGNLIFYESDLRESGLNLAEIARYSGVFTEVFREESGLYLHKIYSFIHMTMQEFMAALHVHETYFSSGVNLLSTSHSETPPTSPTTFSNEHLRRKSTSKIFKKKISKSTVESPESPDPKAFYRSAVDLALKRSNGRFDLFVRFLLGLSLPTNQNLLQGLLTRTGNNSQITQDTAEYIKQRLDEGLLADKSMNLLHCLNELNDCSLMESTKKCLLKGRLSCVKSPGEWLAVSFLLLSSDSVLEEFDLRKYRATEEALIGLLPVIRAANKAILRHSGLTSVGCGSLASILSSSDLTHLDLSNNDFGDKGVELLCEGLKTDPCRLHTLKLSGCLISKTGGTSLASALISVPSNLKELDLSYNHPGPSIKVLTALREQTHSCLDILRLDPAGKQWMIPGLRKYSCQFFLDPNTAHRNLLVSEDKQSVRQIEEEMLYPDHEARFTVLSQVLGSTGLRGRCYWEVEWSGWFVEVAVTYRGIRRKGDSQECWFGNNNHSWTLRICNGEYAVCHKKSETKLSSCSSSSARDCGRVAVFLDSEAGSLSFYEARSGGELFHLHTFSCAFTEPLFPGFGLLSDSSSMLIVT